MKLTEGIYFYEGDYVDFSKKKYFQYYKGMASSNFLVIKDKKQTMIDAGFTNGPHAKRVRAEMEKDNISLRNTDYVLFSHCHPDHIMQAKDMSFEQNMAFMMHEKNENMILNSDYFFEAFFNYPSFVQKEIFKMPKTIIKVILRFLGMNFGYFKVDHFFNETLPLDLGCDIEVIPLFSHCPGHVGYYFRNDKILFTGDLFDMRCAPGADIIASTSSYSQALEDIEKVMALDVDMLIPGHGRIIQGAEKIQSLLKEVYANTRNYRLNILDVLEKKESIPLCLKDISQRVFPDSIAYNAFSRLIIIYNVLKVLHKEEKVDFIIRNNKSFWFLKA